MCANWRPTSKHAFMSRINDSGFLQRAWEPFPEGGRRLQSHFLAYKKGRPLVMTQAYFDRRMKEIKTFGWQAMALTLLTQWFLQNGTNTQGITEAQWAQQVLRGRGSDIFLVQTKDRSCGAFHVAGVVYTTQRCRHGVVSRRNGRPLRRAGVSRTRRGLWRVT